MVKSGILETVDDTTVSMSAHFLCVKQMLHSVSSHFFGCPHMQLIRFLLYLPVGMTAGYHVP